MRAVPFRSSTLCLLIAGLTLTSAAPATTPPPAPVKIASIDALPAAVQKTVRAESAGATVKGIFKEIAEDGKPVYEVEMLVKGLTKDINVGEDGTVLVSEQQMTLDSLPPAVRSGILKAAGKRKIRIIESVTKTGTLAYYEAHVVTGKTLTEIKVGLDGAVIP